LYLGIHHELVLVPASVVPAIETRLLGDREHLQADQDAASGVLQRANDALLYTVEVHARVGFADEQEPDALEALRDLRRGQFSTIGRGHDHVQRGRQRRLAPVRVADRQIEDALRAGCRWNGHDEGCKRGEEEVLHRWTPCWPMYTRRPWITLV